MEVEAPRDIARDFKTYGEENDELDGVNVGGDDDELSLLGLDKGDDVVEAVLDEEGLLGVLGGGVLGLVLGLSLETSLLLLLGLRLVLVHESEELSGGVLVKNVGELSDGRGDLKTLVEDDALALETNVLGPLDEAGHVGLGADVTTWRSEERWSEALTDAEGARTLLEERVLGGLLGDLGAVRRRGGLLGLGGSGLGLCN